MVVVTVATVPVTMSTVPVAMPVLLRVVVFGSAQVRVFITLDRRRRHWLIGVRDAQHGHDQHAQHCQHLTRLHALALLALGLLDCAVGR